MTPAQWRFLILDQTIATGLITAGINAALAWVVFRGRPTVPLWGMNGIISDLAATMFLLPFLVCVISTSVARGRIRAGKLPPLHRTPRELGWPGRLPAGARRRGLMLAALCLGVFVPVGSLGLMAADVSSMSLNAFVAFKAAYTGLLAAALGPLVGLWALLPAEPSAVVGDEPR